MQLNSNRIHYVFIEAMWGCGHDNRMINGQSYKHYRIVALLNEMQLRRKHQPHGIQSTIIVSPHQMAEISRAFPIVPSHTLCVRSERAESVAVASTNSNCSSEFMSQFMPFRSNECEYVAVRRMRNER